MDENRKKIVVDTSVLVKWVLVDEVNTEEAMALRKKILEGRVDVFVPGHCLPELCNVLVKKAPDKALPSLSAIRGMGFIELVLSLELAAIALGLTQRHAKVSFYDAFYHAIALKYGIVFITADRKYYETTKGEGNIELLANYAAAI